MNIVPLSDPTIKALRKFDTNRDGLSVAELKKIDTDGDGQISREEGKQAEICLGDLEKINKKLCDYVELNKIDKKLEKCKDIYHKMNPTEIIFKETAREKIKAGQEWKTLSGNLMDMGDGKEAQMGTFVPISKQYTAPDLKGKAAQLQAKFAQNPANTDRLDKFMALLENHTCIENTGEHFAEVEFFVKKIGIENLDTYTNLFAKFADNGQSRLTATEKAQVIHGIIRELAVPAVITQSTKGTCTALACQTRLAIMDPLEYTKMGLALVENKSYQTANGKEPIQPNDSWRNDSSDNRSFTSKAMQSAFMTAGLSNSLWGTYNSAEDKDSSQPGLTGSNQENLLAQVFDKKQQYDNDLFTTDNSAYAYVEDDLARGRPCLVNIPEHSILVVGMDKSVTPELVIFNSEGIQYQMTKEDFLPYLKYVVTVDDDGFDSHQLPAGQRHMLDVDVFALEP